VKIPYNVRKSSFYDEIQAAVRSSENRLVSGKLVTINLKKKGGWVKKKQGVHLRRSNANEFTIEKALNNWQDWSARLRALATVLRDEGLFGKYYMAHSNGTIKVVEQR